MARGGARVGAGRKPKRPLTFDVIDGGAAPVDGGPSVVPPADLPEDQREFWQQNAGLAIEKRTLTAHTVPAFRELCEALAMKAAMKRQLDSDGLSSTRVTTDVTSGEQHIEHKAHHLLSSYSKKCVEVKGYLKDFALCSFGKAVAGAMKTKADQQKADTRAKFFGGARG